MVKARLLPLLALPPPDVPCRPQEAGRTTAGTCSKRPPGVPVALAPVNHIQTQIRYFYLFRTCFRLPHIIDLKLKELKAQKNHSIELHIQKYSPLTSKYSSMFPWSI